MPLDARSRRPREATDWLRPEWRGALRWHNDAVTWIADLAPCTYLDGLYETDRLAAVGWLGAGHDFASGPVPLGVLDRLAQLLQKPFQRGFFGGFHVCDLGCRQTDGERPWRHMSATTVGGLQVSGGWANLLVPVPAEGIVYAAPSMIVHYMVDHGYRPPDPFCGAVLRCPDMGSVDYLLELAELLPVVRGSVGDDLCSRLRAGERALGSAGERLVPLLREELARAASSEPDRNGRRYAPVETALALASLGVAARAGLPELEAAVNSFPDEVKLQEALDRARATVEP